MAVSFRVYSRTASGVNFSCTGLTRNLTYAVQVYSSSNGRWYDKAGPYTPTSSSGTSWYGSIALDGTGSYKARLICNGSSVATATIPAYSSSEPNTFRYKVNIYRDPQQSVFASFSGSKNSYSDTTTLDGSDLVSTARSYVGSGYELRTIKGNSYCYYTSSTDKVTLTNYNYTAIIDIGFKQKVITYTANIIYYANGAGGNSSHTQKVSGTSATLSFTALVPAKCGFTVPAGRTFGGWGTSSSSINASYNAGTSYNINANGYLELYAIWEYTYEAKWYDFKAQSDPIRLDSYKTARSTWSFTAPSRSMTGYDFVGWYDGYSGNNGTGNLLVGAGEDINLPYKGSRSWYLYARWSVHTYNISFNANGGSGTMNSITNCTYGTDYTLPKNQFTRNYTITLNYNYDNKKATKNAECPFLYWSYNNKIYKDQATVKNLADSGTATLYAQWGNYSVKLPTLIRSGYVFLGWFTSATGGSQVNSPITGMSDRILYAHWKEDVISPTISNVSHTDTTITISLNRNNATTGSWIIEASLSNFGTVVYTKTITSTTQTTITLTGLTPETTYYIRARHVNGGISASSNVISATTRTSTFQWTSNDSVYVIKSAVFTDAITAAKWNELIKKVNWCRGRKGWPTASLNSAVSGQPILATNFTAMRNAIADMHPVTPARSAGDEILATYFANSDTSLKSAINAVITTL